MKKYYCFPLIVLPIFSVRSSSAQKLSYRAHVGIGVTDVAHVGLSRQFGKLDVGAQMGYLEHDMGRIMSGGVSGSLRFRHSKKFNDAPTLYFKQLLNCHNDRNAGYKEWYWLTTEVLMGRNFYFSERFGLSAEGGLIVTIYQTEEHAEGSTDIGNDDDYPSIFPSLRIQLFHRF